MANQQKWSVTVDKCFLAIEATSRWAGLVCVHVCLHDVSLLFQKTSFEVRSIQLKFHAKCQPQYPTDLRRIAPPLPSY